MTTRKEYFRKPDGTVTTDIEAWARDWSVMAQKLVAITGGEVHGMGEDDFQIRVKDPAGVIRIAIIPLEMAKHLIGEK